MSTNQITPEEIAHLRTLPHDNHHLVRRLLDALESSRAEVQRLTEARAIRACECSPEEACAHVRRAEAAEREVQRLAEESRRTGAGRVEAPERAAWLTIEEMAGVVYKNVTDYDKQDALFLARAIAEAAKAKGSRLSSNKEVRG